MEEKSLLLTLTADLPRHRLAEFTREFGRDLSRAGVPSSLAEPRSEQGSRGGAIAVGEIVLALVTTGTIKAVIDCFKAYLTRERSLALRLTLTGGKQLELTANNLDAPAVVKALQSVASSLGQSRRES